MCHQKTLFKSLALSLLAMMTGCSWVPVKQGVFQAPPEKEKSTEHYVPAPNLKPGQFFTSELKTHSANFSTAEEINADSAKINNDYLIGPGDIFSFLVRGREDISRDEIIVAPDGTVALPRVGILKVTGLTQTQVTDEVTKVLQNYYQHPEVTLVMKQYNNNRVFVLGRVATPGAVKFQGPGTLLEALSLCGGMPSDINKTFLSRCSITRGKNLIMWIDLRELLERGNMNLNARLQNGDIIFIPISEDQNAYVLGEVKSPGVIPLRSNISILNAIMTVGGPTKGANLRDVFLIRQVDGKGVVERINLQEMIGKGNSSKNYVLRDGDTIYVPETGLSKFNYFTSQLQPFFTIIGVSTGALSATGLNALYYGSLH